MLRAFLATLLAAVWVAVPAQPAAAGNCTGDFCGYIFHYTPDDDYDPAIRIRCNYGDPATNHLLYEGEGSSKYCKDTDQVGVRDGEEIWCKYYIMGLVSWQKKFDATGWHKIDDVWDDGAGCTLRKD